MRGTWIRRLWLSCLLLLAVPGSVLAQSSVTLSPTTLPDGAIGLAYNETITATSPDASPPYTFSVVVGSLPNGLALASSGELTGTPTQVGIFNFTIQAVDSSTTSNGSRAYQVEIFPEATIEPADLATAQAGVPYYQQLSVANGGSPGYIFSISSGALPIGLMMTAGGLITGTPRAAGDTGFTVTATPSAFSGGSFAPTAAPIVALSKSYILSVVPAPIILAPTSLPDAVRGVAYSSLVTASGGIDPYVFTTSDPLPPGIVLASNGQLSGMPTTDGTYPFVIHATDSLGVSGGQAYSITVGPPPLHLPAADPPNGTVGEPYSFAFEATGGNPPYTYYAETGLPPGLTLENNGLLHGTPTTEGSYLLEVYAYDASEASAGRFYGITIHGIDDPVAVDDEATTPSEQPVSIPVTANDTGVIDTIAIVTAPAHGTATIDGLSVLYQPSGTFHGDDGFTYTASGPTGTSSPASVVVHVTPLEAPAGVPQAVTTQAGVAVTLHAADGASGGPITGLAIVQAPATGSLAVSGTDLTFTPPDDAAGGTQFPIVYTLANAYGVSAAVTSTVTIELMAPPVLLPDAMALEATTETGVPVDVELTSGATGGPFTGAAVVSLSPQDSGTTSVAPSADGYRLTYAPADGFVGIAVASFTLSNVDGTSEPATVTITVTERPDPGDDPEVGGLVGAQVQIVRSFSDAQILNAINRLEQLHEPGKPLSFWIGGSIRKGDSPGREFETSGVTGGMDYRFNDKFAFGGGLGYGRDRSMTGDNGSRTDARAKTGMGYASYRPSLPWFIDMVSGYQRITFELRRFVSASGDMVEAPRDGTQAFSSWSSGYEKKGDKWLFSTYGRMDVAQARLDEYSEGGNPLYALSFGEQAIQTRTSTVGVRGKYKRTIPWGTLEPRFRVELQRDFHDESGAAISYSDLQSGPVYVLPGDELDRSRYIIEIGTIFKSKWGFVMRLDYRGVRGGMYDDDNAIMFSFQDDH